MGVVVCVCVSVYVGVFTVSYNAILLYTTLLYILVSYCIFLHHYLPYIISLHILLSSIIPSINFLPSICYPPLFNSVSGEFMSRWTALVPKLTALKAAATVKKKKEVSAYLCT